MECFRLLPQVGKIAVVDDDVVGGTETLGAAELGAEDRIERLILHTAARLHPFPLQRLRGIHHQHPVGDGGFPGLQEQGDDQHAIRGMQCLYAAAHLGVNAGVEDALEPLPLRRIGEDPAAEPLPIQASVPEDHLLAEGGGDLAQGRSARRDQIAGKLVGIDDWNALLGEVSRNGGLAAADTAGETDD